MRVSLRTRIANHIISRDGCWLTNLSCDRCGYPKIGVDGKIKIAARVFYEIYFEEELEPEAKLSRKCNNRGCINPYHMRITTQQEILATKVNNKAVKTK